MHGVSVSSRPLVPLCDRVPYTDLFCFVMLCCRMAVTCRKLKNLYLISSIENRQAVLNALHETDLGCDGGQSGTIDFIVPSE